MVTPIYPTVTGRSGQSADWARRLLFALGVLLIARLGRQVPIPGIDPAMLGPLFDGRISATGFDVVARTSLFALGLTPFVSAWVVVEIFRGSFSQRNVARNRRWLTAVFAALQAGAVANGYMAVRGVVLEPGQMFWLTTTLSLTAGTMLLLWLGEQITRRGLCDGVWAPTRPPMRACEEEDGRP